MYELTNKILNNLEKRKSMAIAIKNRTRNEIIEAFRESIRKKNECMARLGEIIKEIRREEQRGFALG